MTAARPKLVKDPEYGWGYWVTCPDCNGNPRYSLNNWWGCEVCRNAGEIFEPDDRRQNPPKGGLEFF